MYNKNKRGSNATLTRHIAYAGKECVLRNIPHHVYILPYFILTGLKRGLQEDYDKYSLAEMFMPGAGNCGYQAILNNLYRFADYVSNDQFDVSDVFDLLYQGGSDFSYSDAHSDFVCDAKNLLKTYGKRLDEPRISKCLLNGFPEKDWYSETLKTFEELLPRHDIELFVKIFAITSAKTHLQSNLSNALKAYRLFKRGASFHGQGFLPAVVVMLYDLRKGRFSFNRESCRNGRRKIVNFYCGMMGDRNAVTVDSWIVDAYGLADRYEWRGREHVYTVRQTEYDLIEKHIVPLSHDCGYEPRQVISMLWSGIKKQSSRYKSVSTREALQSLL